MTKFLCEKYPGLVVRDVGVRFVGGQAEVTDNAKIKALRELPAELEVKEDTSTKDSSTVSSAGSGGKGRAR